MHGFGYLRFHTGSLAARLAIGPPFGYYSNVSDISSSVTLKLLKGAVVFVAEAHRTVQFGECLRVKL